MVAASSTQAEPFTLIYWLKLTTLTNEFTVHAALRANLQKHTTNRTYTILIIPKTKINNPTKGLLDSIVFHNLVQWFTWTQRKREISKVGNSMSFSNICTLGISSLSFNVLRNHYVSPPYGGLFTTTQWTTVSFWAHRCSGQKHINYGLNGLDGLEIFSIHLRTCQSSKDSCYTAITI